MVYGPSGMGLAGTTEKADWQCRALELSNQRVKVKHSFVLLNFQWQLGWEAFILLLLQSRILGESVRLGWDDRGSMMLNVQY